MGENNILSFRDPSQDKKRITLTVTLKITKMFTRRHELSLPLMGELIPFVDDTAKSSTDDETVFKTFKAIEPVFVVFDIYTVNLNTGIRKFVARTSVNGGVNISESEEPVCLNIEHKSSSYDLNANTSKIDKDELIVIDENELNDIDVLVIERSMGASVCEYRYLKKLVVDNASIGSDLSWFGEF